MAEIREAKIEWKGEPEDMAKLVVGYNEVTHIVWANADGMRWSDVAHAYIFAGSGRCGMSMTPEEQEYYKQALKDMVRVKYG